MHYSWVTLFLLWVPWRRIATLYSLGGGRPHRSTLTRWRRQRRTTSSQSLSTGLLNQNLLTSGLPSQGLLASCRPRLSPRPRWPPRLRIRLFGQDRLQVFGPTTGVGASSWCPQHYPLRPRSSQSPLQSPLRPRSSQSPLQSPQSPLQSPLRPSLSAACPDPLLCLCLRIGLLYVALDTTVWYLPVWPPLCFNKAASGSNYTASALQLRWMEQMFLLLAFFTSLWYKIMLFKSMW